MKIKVKYQPKVEEVFVYGLWGPKTVNTLLNKINEDIKNVNISLRSLYE